ncbi:aminotransferase class I/II-fold pyridoxal phosphate-dependent enzyme [candidate division KSB1 bacterium]|nr:aminotransferase class I/II-fold pyridoxal phosphate-dependent enzyme [candidate division KSB1 bacterium]
MDIFSKCFNYLDARKARKEGYYPYFQPINSGAANTVEINGKHLIMIGSNNYLGLTQHEHVIEASIKAVEKYGSGCTGSRFLNGTLDIHEELEDRLAKFMRREAALIFSTGFQTNLGVISPLGSKRDTIVFDRENHASLLEGCRLSFSKILKYKHNDMTDLERILANIANSNVGKLIVTDGVFSMGGDIVDLPRICKLAKKYDARIMVDDAHSIGVFGESGRGTASHFGLDDEVDLITGTFSKSFASIGGFVAGDKLVLDYIKHHSRALIYSASMPPAAVAATIAALDIIESEPERRERLWENVKIMKEGFTRLGFNIGNTETPIIPVIIGDDANTFAFWRLLFDNGIFVNPVVSPAVPSGKALLRTSYMATHTKDELHQVLEVFSQIGSQLGIIKELDMTNVS